MKNEYDKCSELCLDCNCDTQQIDFSIYPAPYSLEKVNHPTHYQGNHFEVIDIIEDFKLGFSLGNAIKYILRAGKKGDRNEDLRKAIWYLEREMDNDLEQ